MFLLLMVALLFIGQSAVAADLTNPIVFVKQAKVKHSGGTIQDLFGNFRGANPALDQPVGGGLFLLSAAGEVRQLVGGSDIAVRDPEISFDARKVIFAMKQGAKGKWQIWECDFNGNNLRKLSRNSSVNDFDPPYIPYDRIVFVSDRLRLSEPFRDFPSAQLHLMNADGSDAKMLNANPGGHLNPVSLFHLNYGYGVILFSQFDHHQRPVGRQSIDSLAVSRFLPWFVYRDGSAFDHPLFGTHTIPDFKGGYVAVREIPRSKQLIGVLANMENTYGAGSIVKMKYLVNDDRQEPVYVTPDVLNLKQDNRYGRWRDPYPMADGSIVAVYASGPVYQSKPALKLSDVPNFKIVRLQHNGKNQETLYEDKNFWSLQPVEVVVRRAYAFSIAVTRASVKYAMINSLDVFNRGRNHKKVINGDQQPAPAHGSLAFVRILKSIRRQNAHRSFRHYSSTKFIELGKAPVFSDGSFAALVPADMPLIWELLDHNGKVVVRERFGTTLKGGEVRQCSGCHAPHSGRKGNTTNLALTGVTNLTRFDPDVDNNGVLDILENFSIPGYE